MGGDPQLARERTELEPRRHDVLEVTREELDVAVFGPEVRQQAGDQGAAEEGVEGGFQGVGLGFGVGLVAVDVEGEGFFVLFLFELLFPALISDKDDTKMVNH